MTDDTYGISIVWFGPGGKPSTRTELNSDQLELDLSMPAPDGRKPSGAQSITALDGRMSLAEANQAVQDIYDHAELWLVKRERGGPLRLLKSVAYFRSYK